MATVYVKNMEVPVFQELPVKFTVGVANAFSTRFPELWLAVCL